MHRSLLQNIAFLILVKGLVFLLPFSALGQKDIKNQKTEHYTFIFKGESLRYALQQLVKKTDMDLIYDPKLMQDQDFVYKTAKNKSPEDVLRLLLQGSHLDFIRLSSGTYVLVHAPKKDESMGNLAGKVVDRMTGEPLPGANIMLADASAGTSTDASGFFSIPRLESGLHEITITYIGYKPFKDTVWIPVNKASTDFFSLEAKLVIVEPIVITGLQQRIPATGDFTDKIKGDAYQNMNNLGTVDAIKSLNAIMGINFSLPLADFNIQGGDAGEHRLRLDGVPIYNPVSMGRMIGAFSPFALGDITIHKAGYGSPLGSQLSGIIDVKQDGSNRTGNNILFQADQLNMNGRADHEFDFKNGPKVNLMIAGRTNMWRWYKKSALDEMLQNWDQIDPIITNHMMRTDSSNTRYYQQDHSSDIDYYDLHFAASIQHNPFHRTLISAYRGKNFLETDLFFKNAVFVSDAPEYIYSIDSYDWTNTMGRIEHQWMINPRVDASISAYITHHSLEHKYSIGNDREYFVGSFLTTDVARQQLQSFTGSISQTQTGDQNGITESSATFKLNYSATKNYHINTGLKATHLDYRFHLSDLFYRSAHSTSSSFMLSGYVQNNVYFNTKTKLSAGSRITFIPSRDLVFAEPRVSLSHDEPDTPVGYLSANISGGIYRQFINQFDVTSVGPSALVPSIRFWVPADYTTQVPKAYHLAGNVLWKPDANWTFRIESYYKWLPTTLDLDYRKLLAPEILFYNSDYQRQHQYITVSKQYAYGAGLSVKKIVPALNMNIKAEYQYAIARQRTPERFKGKYMTMPWSQPHQLNINFEWKITPDLTYLLQWQSIWGRSWGFRKAYYDYLSLDPAISYDGHTFNDPSKDRLSVYHQLDTGISYQMDIRQTDIQFRIDIFNLLNSDNVLNWWLSPYENSDGTLSYRLKRRMLPGFNPSLSIKFSY